MRYPKNADEVVAIVNEAINRGVKVKAFGARHSQTDIICTDGIPVDMTKLKSFYMNADNVTATFGSGVTVRQAGEFLFKHRRSLRNTPAFGNITLGGAIGEDEIITIAKFNTAFDRSICVCNRNRSPWINDQVCINSIRTSCRHDCCRWPWTKSSYFGSR